MIPLAICQVLVGADSFHKPSGRSVEQLPKATVVAYKWECRTGEQLEDPGNAEVLLCQRKIGWDRRARGGNTVL